MYPLQNNTIKTVTASFLAALLVGINVLKIVHKHSHPYEKESNSISINVASVNAYFSCDICNFQIAKDSDANIATWQISEPIYYTSFVDDFTIKIPGNKSIAFNVRGPPSKQVLV